MQWMLFAVAWLGVGTALVSAGPERAWPSWLGEWTAFREGAGLVLAWRTVNEAGLVGFTVDRLQPDESWERVGDDMVVAVQSEIGARYEVSLPITGPTEVCVWRVAAWDSDLRRHPSPRLTGEVLPARPMAAADGAAAPPIDLAPRPPTRAQTAARLSRPGTGVGNQRIRCATREEGWHRIFAEDIARCLGEPTGSIRERVRQRKLSLTHRGKEVGYIVEADGAALLFWAEPYRNNYTELNVYWLTEGESAPLACLNGQPPGTPARATCRATTDVEHDILSRYDLADDPDEDYWFWARLVGSHPVVGQATVSFPIDALASDDTPALLRLRVAGGTVAEHRVVVEVNGYADVAWQTNWTGKVPCELQAQIPPECLHEGTNRIKLIAGGSTKSQWYFDGFRLEHGRPCQASHDMFELTLTDAAPLSVGGFSSADIRVLDITLPSQPALVTNVVVDQHESAYRVTFSPPTAPGRYSAFAESAPMSQPDLECRTWTGLAEPTHRADLLILGPWDFLPAVEPLAAHRRNQGLQVMTVSVESVYDEFNDGISEPESIRRFLRNARAVWAKPPAYVLLVGNGTYDYRNLQGRNDNLMPPLMVPTPFGLFASDSAYGDIESGPAPELAVGRLPVRSPEALAKLIQKIIAHETAARPAEPKALLVADETDPAAGDFVQDILTVREVLGDVYRTVLAYPGAVPNVRETVLDGLRAGVDLVCFLGHGAVDQLGVNKYLLSSDVAALANGARLPLLMAMTCLAGQFSVPDFDSLAEALVLSPGEGAIAVISPTGLSIHQEASELNLELVQRLKAPDLLRIGDCVREAMVAYNQDGPRGTPSAIYGIIGDPCTPYAVNLAHPPSLTIRLQNDHAVLITVQGARGQAYRIGAADEITAPTRWEVVTNILVGASPASFILHLDPSTLHRFYRVQAYP